MTWFAPAASDAPSKRLTERAVWLVQLLSGALVSAGLSLEVARADECNPARGVSGCIDSDELWARPGASPYVAVGPGTTTPRGQVSFDVQVSYAKRPIVMRTAAANLVGRDVYLVDNLFDGAFLFAVGVTDRFEVTLALPVAFYEDGAGTGFLVGSGSGLPRSAARDGRFGFAYAFLKHPNEPRRAPTVSLIGRLEIGAPYGDGSAFARARTATLAPAVTADLRVDRLDVSGEVGARLRGETELLDVTWGSQLDFSLGASVRVWDPPRLTVGAEAFVMPGLSNQRSGTVLLPGEWMVDVGAAPVLDGDVSFGISGGSSMFTQLSLTAPLYRFGATVRYAPTGAHATHRPSAPPQSSLVPVPPLGG